MEHIFNANTQEEEEGRLKVKSHPGLYNWLCFRKWGGAHVGGVVDVIK